MGKLPHVKFVKKQSHGINRNQSYNRYWCNIIVEENDTTLKPLISWSLLKGLDKLINKDQKESIQPATCLMGSSRYPHWLSY